MTDTVTQLSLHAGAGMILDPPSNNLETTDKFCIQLFINYSATAVVFSIAFFAQSLRAVPRTEKGTVLQGTPSFCLRLCLRLSLGLRLCVRRCVCVCVSL